MTSMPADAPTLVFPGGRTRCLFSAEPDYAFQVFRGDPDKLLVYFQESLPRGPHA